MSQFGNPDHFWKNHQIDESGVVVLPNPGFPDGPGRSREFLLGLGPRILGCFWSSRVKAEGFTVCLEELPMPEGKSPWFSDMFPQGSAL